MLYPWRRYFEIKRKFVPISFCRLRTCFISCFIVSYFKKSSFSAFSLHKVGKWDKSRSISFLASLQEHRGGERMSPSKRQQELLKVLCHRRHDTYDNLSFEFHISRRTICRDVAILMCSYPIESLPSFEMCTSLSIPTALIFSQPFETPVGCFRAIPLKIPCGIIKVVFYHLPPLFN